jgi:hypothetical protein
MTRRLTRAILLLYPRRVRERHGPEIVALIDELIANEGRSRVRLFIRLAIDGLVQRTATTTTAWTVTAVLTATSLAGLAASGFAAASAHHGALRTVPTVATARHTHTTSNRHEDPARRHAGPRGRSRGDSTSLELPR